MMWEERGSKGSNFLHGGAEIGAFGYGFLAAKWEKDEFGTFKEELSRFGCNLCQGELE